jgi:hypothetical protein
VFTLAGWFVLHVALYGEERHGQKVDHAIGKDKGCASLD